MAPTRRTKASGRGGGVEQVGEGCGRVEVGHHDGSRHDLSLPQVGADHRTILDHDAGHLGVAAQLTPVLCEQPARWSAMVPRPPRTFDIVAVPGGRQREGQAERRPPVRRGPGRWS